MPMSEGCGATRRQLAPIRDVEVASVEDHQCGRLREMPDEAGSKRFPRLSQVPACKWRLESGMIHCKKQLRDFEIGLSTEPAADLQRSLNLYCVHDYDGLEHQTYLIGNSSGRYWISIAAHIRTLCEPASEEKAHRFITE